MQTSTKRLMFVATFIAACVSSGSIQAMQRKIFAAPVSRCLSGMLPAAAVRHCSSKPEEKVEEKKTEPQGFATTKITQNQMDELLKEIREIRKHSEHASKYSEKMWGLVTFICVWTSLTFISSVHLKHTK